MGRRVMDDEGDAAVQRPIEPNWEDLRIALAVARAQSLARAADILGVDPGTVSRRIGAAEAALGTILFVRSKTGVTLTDAGRALLTRAAEMEARARRLVEEVAEPGPIAGIVRVVTSPWVAARLAHDLAPRLAALHPQVTLRLVATRPDWQALPGEATVSLWHETQPQGGDFAIQLGTIDYVLYGLPGETADKAVTIGHWFDDSGSRGPARNVSAETAPDRWVLARKEPKAGFRLTTTDSLVLREAIRAGMGPALLPVALGDPDLDLVRVPPGRVAVRRPVMLHAHPDTVELGRVQAVIALLRRHFDAIFEAAAPHGVEPTEAGGSKGAVPLRGRRRP